MTEHGAGASLPAHRCGWSGEHVALPAAQKMVGVGKQPSVDAGTAGPNRDPEDAWSDDVVVQQAMEAVWRSEYQAKVLRFHLMLQSLRVVSIERDQSDA